jgi:hypothetical protein
MRLTTTLAAAILAAPAMAASLPNMQPAHDVSGSYLITTEKGPRSITIEYGRSANILRVNLPGPRGAYILYDFTAKDAKMVMPQMQRYMDASRMAAGVAARTRVSSAESANITQTGTETIAGHTCQDYQIANPAKATITTICVTDDGVILSLLAPNGDKILAQSVSYSPVNPTDLQLPPGYTQFQRPAAGTPPGSGQQ